MARVLVTGASGFIGVEVVRALAARGDAVAAFDLAIGPELKRLQAGPSNLQVATGTIAEWHHIAHLMRAFRPDAVVHCAAVVGVAATAESPFETMRINIDGALNVLEAMRLFGVQRLVNLSSEEIYGPFETDRITEDHPCRPHMPYGISKYAVEQLARDYRRMHGIDAIHVRTCWVYGPGLPRPRVPKNFVDAIVAARPLHVASGAEFRVDQVYIDDLVTGILAVLDKPVHRFDAYHIATGAAPPLSEVVAILKSLAPDAELSIGPGPYRFADRHDVVRKGALDITRARDELGYVPQFPLAAGLAAYLAAARRAARS